VREVKQLERDGIANMKNLTHTIRDLLEGKAVEDPNKEDLAKLKAVAKVKDEKDVEEKLDEVLEYGTQQAANQYAKDTPGQTPGHEPNPIEHQHKPNLAVDGVPVPGGQIKKPNFDKDAGMGKVTAKEEVEVDESMTPNSHGYNVQHHAGQLAKKDGKDINKLPYGHAQGYRDKAAAALKNNEGFGDMVNKVKDKIKKAADDVKNFKNTDTAAQIRKNKTTKGVSMEQKDQEMNKILDSLIEKYNLQEALSQAEKDARRDAAKEYGKPKVDPADVDHDHKPEPKKRGRGERDLPHITTQLRGVIDMGDKHSGVKFKDGTTKKVHPDHAKSWLAKHDSAKPAHKLAMYKSHDSHSEFMKHK